MARDPGSDGRDADAMAESAARARLRAEGVARSLLRAERGSHRARGHAVTVRPLVVIWGPAQHQFPEEWEVNGIPFVGGLAPRDHVLLETAPPEVLAALGPLMQRISAAVKAIPGVARCHFARWGDGSEHFHLWALARPEGMMQGRGAVLALWDDVLPAMPDQMVRDHLAVVAEGLASGGGRAFPEAGVGASDA